MERSYLNWESPYPALFVVVLKRQIKGDPREQIVQGIRTPDYHDFRDHFEMWELHLGNFDYF
jgi:hypothetical protein